MFYKTTPWHHQRLVKLGLESLELRRIRLQICFFAYKIIFGIADVDSEDIFTVRASNSRRGHSY